VIDMAIPEERQALARVLLRQPQKMTDDDPEETPGYQPRQMQQRRPFYVADQMDADDVQAC